MKKIITLFALCLFVGAFTQNSHAQTKEETIAWIKEKMEKYSDKNSESYNVKVTPCQITYTSIRKDIYNRRYTNAYVLTEISFPTTSFISVKETAGFIEIDFDIEAVEVKLYVKYGTLQEYILDYTNRTNSVDFIKNAESNLVERMEKALKHLATFCVQKKEAF